jgi:outer membrane lipoprotein-sorting protein
MLRKTLPGLFLAAVLGAPAAGQTVDELIAKSLEARGGLDKLRAIQSIRMTGKMSASSPMGPMELPMVIEMKRPASFRADITVQGTLAVQAYDGTTAWGISPMGTGQAEALPAEAAKEMADQADLDGPLVDYRAKGHQVELLGKEKAEGSDAYKLKVTKKDGDIEYIFLDAESYLPVRVEAKRLVRGTEIEGESTLGEYKEAGGFLWPYSIQNVAKGRPEEQSITVEKIEINPAIDDARFKMPAAKPAEAPKKD